MGNSAAAQSAALQDFCKKMSVMKNFSLQFSYVMQNAGSVEVQTSGTLSVSSEKFRMDMSGKLIIYDGNARYSLLKKEKEVIIETPNPMHDGILADPSAIFSINPKDFNVKEISNANKITTLELTPKQNGMLFEKITLGIQKSTLFPQQIIYYSNDGQVMSLIINDFKANVQYAADAFIFNVQQYPDAEVVDLR
jgi:outer membrane lipoprotein-sorting protein